MSAPRRVMCVCLQPWPPFLPHRAAPWAPCFLTNTWSVPECSPVTLCLNDRHRSPACRRWLRGSSRRAALPSGPLAAETVRYCPPAGEEQGRVCACAQVSAGTRALPHRLLSPRAKIKPADPPARESWTGESSVCRLRRVPRWREPRRAHLRPPPSPPCLKRSGLPTGQGMATPPKRSCPSPAASSEGTRIKKISIEGNIGKGPREMLVPKQG